MKLSEIYALADEFAPKRLSDEYCARYNAYDNSGILVDTGADIRGVLFSLDLSFGAIREAKAAGFNLIITHHPAIYAPIKRLDYVKTRSRYQMVPPFFGSFSGTRSSFSPKSRPMFATSFG